jgi:Ca2+-binding EF-hand superfamily protein
LGGMDRVLANIGFGHRLSHEEMDAIFDELRNDSGEISVQKSSAFTFHFLP